MNVPVSEYAMTGNTLSSAAVTATFKCSRRMAEMRFRQAAGHSILDEIQSVRLARAKELLSNTTQDMSCIANFCGFKAANAFWKFFRQETGVSPTEWRMKTADDDDSLLVNHDLNHSANRRS